MSNNCPCCSGKAYNLCCGRFLDQGQFAKTAEQLMRSRYSAFALGGYGEYLLMTWQGAETMGMNSFQLSKREHDWCGLEIVDKSQSGNKAMVEFKAMFRNGTGEMETLHERSQFERVNSHWYYVSGEINP